MQFPLGQKLYSQSLVEGCTECNSTLGSKWECSNLQEAFSGFVDLSPSSHVLLLSILLLCSWSASLGLHVRIMEVKLSGVRLGLSWGDSVVQSELGGLGVSRGLEWGWKTITVSQAGLLSQDILFIYLFLLQTCY